MIPDNAVTSAIVETAARDVADAILDALADADTWTAPAVLAALAPVASLDGKITALVLRGVRRAKGETSAADVTAEDIDRLTR